VSSVPVSANSPLRSEIPPPRTCLSTLPIDQRRGIWGMGCTIATEAMLFVCMFGAYYYLGTNKDRWTIEMPPSLKYPFILLAILLASSLVLNWGERAVAMHRVIAGRIALWITVALGLIFLLLQAFEYRAHWFDLAPYSDSYGSIFYAITTLHAAHVIVGLMLLCYVGSLPFVGVSARSPHKAYKTISMYWHFVDVVWIFIVLLLYIIPHFQRLHHVH
jgi:heme/copper-type cytochrome/quinol oxidase subunit 3